MRTLMSLAACVIASTGVMAQSSGGSPAVLRGFVLADSSETPLQNAEVSIESIGLSTRAGADGAFRLGAIMPGTYILRVRALGYTPLVNRIRFAPGDSLERDFLLVRAAVPIAGVEVKGRGTPSDPRLAAFDARMRLGIGTFVTAATLDSMADRRLGDILSSRVASANVVNRGTSAWIATRRGIQSIKRRPATSRADLARGADPTACYAAVFLDGALVYGGNEGESLFDINSLQTREVAAVEFYAGGSEIPPAMNGTRPTCGVLAIWTR